MGTIGIDAPSTLRRSNSVASPAVPTNIDLPTKNQSSSFPLTNGDKASYSAVDFELVPLRSPAYTSLKDLMPSSPAIVVQSPTGAGTPSCFEISIRNRLVKQAAWAYLQPMSALPDSSGRHFFRRIWVRFSSEYLRIPVDACLGFFNRHIIPTIKQAFNRLMEAIWIGMNRRR